MSEPIRLNPPAGFVPYGGAGKSYQPSAERVDGQSVHYFGQCGLGPWGFGMYVFRQAGSNQASYIRYKDGPVMAGRGELAVGGDGRLYVTGSESDRDQVAVVYEVPGFVPFGAVKPSPSVPGVDERLAALEARVSSLERRLGAVEGVAAKANERALNALSQLAGGVFVRADTLVDRVNEIIWNSGKVVDRIYAEASNAQSGLAGVIRAIALQEARAFVEELWRRWTTYEDHRLFDVVWDRGVKLLRYKERSGKSADQLPVNDPANLGGD